MNFLWAKRGWQDSVKTRMQTQTKRADGGPLKYTSTIQTLSYVVKAEGFTKLWKGFTPYFARSGTHTVSRTVGTLVASDIRSF